MNAILEALAGEIRNGSFRLALLAIVLLACHVYLLVTQNNDTLGDLVKIAFAGFFGYAGGYALGRRKPDPTDPNRVMEAGVRLR